MKPKTLSNPKWRRVVFKISGAALAGNCQNIDPKVAMQIAREVTTACRLGVEVAIVVGGRNFFCGDSWVSATGLDRPTAYQIGSLRQANKPILYKGSPWGHIRLSTFSLIFLCVVVGGSAEIHSEEVGEGNEGGTGLFEACRLVEVSVIGEVEEDDLFRSESTRSKDELMSTGGCISQRPKDAEGLRAITRDNECYSWRPLPRSRSRFSSSNLAFKTEKGWRGTHETEARSSKGGPIVLSLSKLQCSKSSAKEVLSIVHSQELSKLKGPSVSARHKARSWPPSLKVSPFAPKRKLDGGVLAEANLDIFRGSSVFNQGVSSSVPEISKDFTVEIEGDEGLSRCSLANKVCLPLLASFENGHPLVGAFVPKSFPISSVSAFHSFRCQPISSIPLESNFVSQVVPFSNFPGDEYSRLVSVSTSKGVAFPLEASNQKFKGCSFLREPLSSPEELCISGRVSSPEPEPPTLPLEGFQIEGLTPRKMVKKEEKNCLWNPGRGLGGDFNVIRRISEKLGDSRLTFNMRCFDEFIRESGLLDPPLRNAAFTWSNMQVDPICKRFENMWLLHPKFKENFRDWWQECMVEGWESHKFMRKLKFVKSKLKDWNKVAFGDLRERKNLILSNLGASWRVEGLDWVPISRESAAWLDRPFIEEEVRLTVFQLNKEKAPGPDGFTIAVYQDCWNVIKENLMRVFLEFHTNGIINQRCLRKVLHETIFGSQGAFVEGRHILDAVLIANKVVDEKRRSGEEGVVFKIDFEKAYDYVDWGFLDHVLERKEFSPKWRSWIRGCLSSSSFAILVNGNAKGKLMIKAEETGLTEGFFVGRDRTRVSLLQFVDDTIFFSKASLEHLQNLKIILWFLGKVSEWPLYYLGFPLGGNPKTIDFWDPVVERISRRLDVSIASKIEKLQRDFLWFGVGEGKKDHLIRWDVVCRPNELRGLGFGKTSLRNIALLGKWLWRFLRERNGLWHKVIASIYGTHPNGWTATWWLDGHIDSRAWFLPSSSLFSVKSFFLALSKFSNPTLFLPAKFLWSSKAPSKVKALAWLVVHGKVNTNDKLQLRRPYKSLCPQWCILCKGNGESIDHRFLHCPVTIGLWHKLFNLAGLAWVPPRSIVDMMVIAFKVYPCQMICFFMNPWCMMATVMNSILLQSALEKLGVQTRVQSAFPTPEVAEPYSRQRAIRHLEKGRVVIFGGIGAGTGNPLFTTDTAAALRASEINADAVLKGTNVNGIYDCHSANDNVVLDHLSFREVASRGISSMDMMAITYCEENGIPVVIFNLLEPGNISRALCGDQVAP
ncbi:Uridylate kinase [Vitis vinifera]|uniref:UMP kinase n=1 Tax=Vitis vinifera TaxID=29760 RepID=A0A438GGS3_VITVI|nr:Uridylate kinase [Vitis vinifera]